MSAIDDRPTAAAHGPFASLVSPQPGRRAVLADTGRVTLPRCSACRAPFSYPRALCPRCGIPVRAGFPDTADDITILTFRPDVS